MFNNPVANIVVGSVITIAGIVLANIGGQTLGTGIGQIMANSLEAVNQNQPIQIEVNEG